MKKFLAVAVPTAVVLLTPSCGEPPTKVGAPEQVALTDTAAPSSRVQSDAGRPEQDPAVAVAERELSEVRLLESIRNRLEATGADYEAIVGLVETSNLEVRRSALASLTPEQQREVYDAIAEHDWFDPNDEPLSTFGLDVDGAAFTNVRRFLEDGSLPPTEAVRIEECVNWFRYEPDADRVRAGDLPIDVATEMFASPWNAEHRILRVALSTEAVDFADVPPCNFVFLVDVSGSMSSQDKLPLLQRGLRLVSQQLRPQDKISIVTYAGRSSIHLEPTNGDERDTIERAIDTLRSGGSTHASEGIVDAYRLARQNQTAESIDRVILATDGDFNVGVTNRDELTELITKQKKGGVFLSVLGFGSGNLNDANCEALANKGDGNYAYIDSVVEARRVLVEQMGATLVTVAKDAKVQIEFNPAFVQAYRQIGYENRALAHRDFNDDTKDGGELGAGHQVTVLYEIVPPGAESPLGSVDPLRYGNTDAEKGDDAWETNPVDGVLNELCLVKLRAKHPDADSSIRHDWTVAPEVSEPSSNGLRACAAAAFALKLKNSPHLGDTSYDRIVAMLDAAQGADPNGEWALLRRLVQTARDLVATEPGGLGG
ncbi:MAG: von Willebrand factor type A domain-containing protein [Planctomycetota bacterium]